MFYKVCAPKSSACRNVFQGSLMGMGYDSQDGWGIEDFSTPAPVHIAFLLWQTFLADKQSYSFSLDPQPDLISQVSLTVTMCSHCGPHGFCLYGLPLPLQCESSHLRYTNIWGCYVPIKLQKTWLWFANSWMGAQKVKGGLYRNLKGRQEPTRGNLGVTEPLQFHVGTERSSRSIVGRGVTSWRKHSSWDQAHTFYYMAAGAFIPFLCDISS